LFAAAAAPAWTGGDDAVRPESGRTGNNTGDIEGGPLQHGFDPPARGFTTAATC
jgi:hypothetical protein